MLDKARTPTGFRTQDNRGVFNIKTCYPLYSVLEGHRRPYRN